MDDLKYLKKVLSTWTEFCKTHKNIERAIRNVIEENERLKNNLPKLIIQNENCDISNIKSFFDKSPVIFGSYGKATFEIIPSVEEIKCAAYKEFAKKLKEKAQKYEWVSSGVHLRTEYTISEYGIYELLKEMGVEE